MKNCNWYKKAQYEVEEYQSTPIPALPQAAGGIRDNGEIIDPLPLTPDKPAISLSFENEHVNSYHEQDDYLLLAIDKESKQPLGGIEYSIFRHKTYINNILLTYSPCLKTGGSKLAYAR